MSMRRGGDWPAGRVDRLMVDGPSLAGNMLGDPTRRRVDVYVPPGHDGQGLPLLVDLVGFTAGGPNHTNWRGFDENVPERADRLIAAGAMAPCVMAFPDCFTRLGGNQYVDSVAMGRWEGFLIDDMLPVLERRYGCGGAGRRGVFGKSSGGYGALMHGLRHADVWSAVACHSGDMGFELCYLKEMPGMLRLLARHDGSIEGFIQSIERANGSPQGTHGLMMLAMAATYDPDPEAFLGIRLPVDPRTCELIEARWENWRAHDPTRLIDRHAESLKSLKLLYIDCGLSDQYDLLYGARRFTDGLKSWGLAHRYEEFEGTHSNVDHRMDVSLPLLASALA